MSPRPKILFLVHRVPFPPNRGDRIRSYHILKSLAEWSDVSLATLADEPLEPGTHQELDRLCERVAIDQVSSTRWLRAAVSLLAGRSATEGLFASTNLRRTLDSWTRTTPYDAVVVFCSSMMQYLQLPGLKSVRAIIDLVDVDSQKFLDYAQEATGLKRLLYQTEGQRLRTLERTLPYRARAITLVSEAEADLYRTICPNDRTLALENGVDLNYFQPQDVEASPFHCVFVGAMDYYPNASGIKQFCWDVWPQILSRYPAATLAIVGRNPPPDVKSLVSTPGIEVTGTVPDVRPHVAKATAVVVPLKIARGVQNKILEAMAMGKPVIASPQALDGLQAQPEQDLLSACSADEWVSQISRLFEDSLACRELAISARQYVENRHAWSITMQPLAELIGWETAPKHPRVAATI
ncbi:TIGR03087 family PEP-CTERM/XrtA system glycosyltransferase [Anatilimnocola sp. NA78]|uniref:TIGR03087 family PEP-CTERM/XrtA system glycosyltransferase n=1 Tax=Anatilimnocola sp. NA78 TaxID=3415683 RepID=UPI003CE500A0